MAKQELKKELVTKVITGDPALRIKSMASCLFLKIAA
jgi:hypothetical protein